MSDAFKFIEISRPGSLMILQLLMGRHDADYTFHKPGGGRLPGLKCNSFLNASSSERQQQIDKFKHTKAVNLRAMEPKCDLGVLALFPNLDTIMRNCSIPVPAKVPIVVDCYWLTKLTNPHPLSWAMRPEMQALGADLEHDMRKRTGPDAHKLTKHVLQITYYPKHPRLGAADIELTLPEGGTEELVILFIPSTTSVAGHAPCEMFEAPEAQPCGMLHGVVAGLASKMADKYTLVGVDKIPRRALGFKNGDGHRFQDRILTATRIEMLKNKSDDSRGPAAFVEFLTMDEYRDRIGAYQFGVETETF